MIFIVSNSFYSQSKNCNDFQKKVYYTSMKDNYIHLVGILYLKVQFLLNTKTQQVVMIKQQFAIYKIQSDGLKYLHSIQFIECLIIDKIQKGETALLLYIYSLAINNLKKHLRKSYTNKKIIENNSQITKIHHYPHSIHLLSTTENINKKISNITVIVIHITHSLINLISQVIQLNLQFIYQTKNIKFVIINLHLHKLQILQNKSINQFDFKFESNYSSLRQIAFKKMSENQKFKKVRSMLDELKYLGTLHPDSVNLVDAILKDYMKYTGKVFELQKKCRDLQSKNKNNNNLNNSVLDDKIDFLNQKNFQLQQQNKKLKSQINSSQAQQKLLMLQGKLTQFQVKYTQQIQQLVKKSKEATQKIQELNYKNTRLIQENNKLKQKSYKAENHFEEFNDQLKDIISKKSNEIKELEENNSRLRIKVSTLESMLEDTKQELENQILIAKKSSSYTDDKSASSTISLLKDQLSNMQKKVSILKNSQIQLIQERQKFKRQNKKLSQKLSYLQNLQLQSQNHENLHNNTKQKYQKMYEQLEQRLNKKQQSLQGAQEKINQYEKQLQLQSTKIKDLMKKNTFLQQSLSKVNQQINLISIKLNQKTKQLRQSQNKKTSLQRQVHQLQSSIRQSQQQLLKQKSQLSFKQLANPNHVEKIKSTYQNQIKLINKQLMIFKENQHQLIIQKEKISIQNQKLHRIMEEGNKQLEIIQNQKETYMKENKELKNRLEKGNNTGFDNKNQIIRLEEKIQGLQMFVDELKSSTKQNQNQKKILQQQILELQKQISQNQLNKKQLFQDNKQLIIQIKSLQARKQQIFNKYKQLQQANNMQANSSVQYKKQYLEIKSKYNLAQKELEKLKIDLIKFDQERDDAYNELDKKCEEIEKLNRLVEKYENDLRQNNRGLNQSQININAINKRLEQYQQQNRYLQKVNQQLQTLYNKQSRKTISDQQVEIKRLQNQINLILMGNKQIERQNQRMRQRLKDLQNKKTQKFKQYEEERQKSTTLAILNKELAQQLKSQKQQVNRLTNIAEELSKQNNKMFDILTQRDKEIQEMVRALNQYEFKESQYMNEITYYEKQINQLSDQLEAKDRELGEVVLQRDSFKAQRNWRRDESINSLSESNWKQLYQNKNDQLKQQYQMKRQQNQNLRNVNKQLQHLVNQLRTKIFFLQKGGSPDPRLQQQTKKDFNKFSNCHEQFSISSQQYYRTHSEHPRQRSTPIKNIMTQSLVQSHHHDNDSSSNSQNINRQNLDFEHNKTLPIYSEKDKQKSYLSGHNGSEYGRDSQELSKLVTGSKISKTAKSRYDRLEELDRKYKNTMLS